MDQAITTIFNEGQTASDAEQHPMLIGGVWQAAAAGEWFEVLNPATGGVLGRVPRATRVDVDQAVGAARAAFPGWAAEAPASRAQRLNAIADDLEAAGEAIAKLLAQETGNAIRTQSRGEVAMAVGFVRYFASTGEHMTGTTVPLTRDVFNYTIREPLGVVGAIIPWNTPVALIALKAAMAISTGNCLVLKTAEDAPLASLAVARIFDEHLPAGVLNALSGFGHDCGRALSRHPDVDKLTFTGSSAVGKEIMGAAAERIVPVSLELGGKNPVIVFPDSDTDLVAQGVITGMRFARQGQSCTAGSRLFLHETIFDSFLARISRQLAELRVGNPSAEDTDIGSIINEKQYVRVRDFLMEAEGLGAKFLTGSVPLPPSSSQGYFIDPVVLTGVTPEWRIAREEVFGPVLVAIPWSDIDEAVRLANDSHYGLSAYVWSRDIASAVNTAHQIDSGWVQINRGLGQLPGMTYGGFKESGLGAECSQESAIWDFTRIKTVTVGLRDA